MKKRIIFLILIFQITITGLLAQVSQLTIFHQEGERFWVIIDGVKQNAQPQASVYLPDLKESFIRVKIIFENEKIKDIDRSLPTRDADGNHVHSKYIIRNDKKNKVVMRFHSFEPVQQQTVKPTTPAAPIPQEPVTQQQTTVTQTTTVKQPSETISVGAYVTDPETGKPVGMDVTIRVPAIEAEEVGFETKTVVTPKEVVKTETTVTTHVTETGIRQPVHVTPAEKPNVYKMPGYSGKIGCPWPMSDADFNNVIRSIKSKSFDDTKLTVAKQIVSSNCMLCSQVKEIMLLFSFEETRLDFAKYAYRFVHDIGNYYKLNDAFSFSSSVEELDEYIRQK